MLEDAHVGAIVWCLEQTLFEERFKPGFAKENFGAVMKAVTRKFAAALCGRLDDGRRHTVSNTNADSLKQLARLDLGEYPQLFDVQG